MPGRPPVAPIRCAPPGQPRASPAPRLSFFLLPFLLRDRNTGIINSFLNFLRLGYEGGVTFDLGDWYIFDLTISVVSGNDDDGGGGWVGDNDHD